MTPRTTLPVLLLFALVAGAVGHAQEAPAKGLYSAWSRGPSNDPAWFPIGVYLQNPARAGQYREIGINLYVGLWKGPTEEHLSTLAKHKMPVVCHQNDVGLAHREDPLIVGWLQKDEPDNAQGGAKLGFGRPVPPEKIVARYEAMRKADPSRPVLLNLGQGVGWDGWHGRGARTNHPEDYPKYLKGADVVSFDIYPAAHTSAKVRGQIWRPAFGVERLVRWSEGRKPVWCILECTDIQGAGRATPRQMRAEAWLAIIAGARGIVWFAHEIKPKFREHALLAEPSIREAVAAVNREILAFAPVLNGDDRVKVDVRSSADGVPIGALGLRHDGAVYLFAGAMRDGRTTGTFAMDVPGAKAEVLGEDRTVEVKGGRLTDTFDGPEDVHLYRIR
jgi:hypothetical protein